MPAHSTTRDVARSLALVAMLALPAVPARAQNGAQLSLFGGVATDQRGQRSNAVGVAPSLTFAPNANTALTLGANATRYATQAWSLGGSAGFTARQSIGGPVAFTLQGAGAATRLQATDAGTFILGDLSPALELRVSRVTLFGGARATGATVNEVTRSPGLFGPGTRTSRVSRVGAGPMYGAVLALGGADRLVELSAREDRTSLEGTTFTDRAVSLAVAIGGVAFSATGGRRFAPDERDDFGTVTLAIPVAGSLALEAAGGTYAANRFLGTPAGDFLSVGLGWRFGPPRTPSLPRPAGVEPPRRGATRLALRAPDARGVEVFGDFNAWRPVPARRASNGVWYADLTIPPGRYRYAFRVNGVEWRVPDGATAVDDGFGGKSAWLEVR